MAVGILVGIIFGYVFAMFVEYSYRRNSYVSLSAGVVAVLMSLGGAIGGLVGALVAS